MTTIPNPAAVTPATIVLYMSSDNVVTLTDLDDMTGWTEMWFTAKDDLDLPDTGAVVQLHVTSSPDYMNDGLLYLNGQAPDPPYTFDLTDGEIDVLSATSVSIVLSDVAAALLPRIHEKSAYWGIKAKIAGKSVIVAEGGFFEVRPVTTKAV